MATKYRFIHKQTGLGVTMKDMNSSHVQGGKTVADVIVEAAEKELKEHPENLQLAEQVKTLKKLRKDRLEMEQMFREATNQ